MCLVTSVLFFFFSLVYSKVSISPGNPARIKIEKSVLLAVPVVSLYCDHFSWYKSRSDRIFIDHEYSLKRINGHGAERNKLKRIVPRSVQGEINKFDWKQKHFFFFWLFLFPIASLYFLTLCRTRTRNCTQKSNAENSVPFQEARPWTLKLY